MASDFMGKELCVGDKVIFNQLAYRNFLIGTISKLTEKMVFISHDETNVCSKQTKQKHDQVIKIED